MNARKALWISPLLAMSSAAATLMPVDANTGHPPIYRTEFSEKDAPPGIRLKVFLQWFYVEDPGREMVMKSRLSDADFSAADHDKLLRYFEELFGRIESEVNSGIRDLACHDKASNLSADQVRAIFNAIDDLRNATYAKYVAVASGELAIFGYVDLPEKLEAMQNAFVDVGFEYRDKDTVSDKKILEARTEICRKWYAN